MHASILALILVAGPPPDMHESTSPEAGAEASPEASPEAEAEDLAVGLDSQPRQPERDTSDEHPAPPRRLLPLSASSLGLTVGVLSLGVGALLWALDGKCTTRLDAPSSSCPKIFASFPAAISMLALGASASLGFGVVLGIDAQRQRRAGLTAGLSWRLHF